MSPTVPNNIGADKRPVSSGRPSTGERRSELVCRVKYCNALPDIPFDPKFITYPFESTRFIQYNPTSLERNYKYEVLTEHDLGVTIDLINRDLYAADPGATLDIADEKLLEEDILTPHDSRRSRHHGRSVSWLRRTEYISTEQTRFQPQVMDKVEAKVGYSIKKSLKEETLYMDRESQIKAIEKTFQDNQKPIERHYSKANVTPVEVLEVFPDFKMWKYPCAQVMFDSDPAPVGRPFPAQLEEMSQAMIRGVMDESGEQFVAYFLPTESTLEKRRRDFTDCVDYVDEEEYEYKIAREYNWNVKTKASKGYEENYFLVVRPDGVFFNELETRVRLTKRRLKAGQQPNNTRLVVKHRPMNAQEFNIHRRRERQLEPPQEEEEEEEEEDEEDDEEDKADDNKKSCNDDSDSDKENRDVRGGSKSSKKGIDEDASSGNEGSDGEKDKSDQSDKSDAENSDGGKSDRSEKSSKSVKSNRSDKSDRSDTSGKSDKSQKSNRSDKSIRSDGSNQSGRSNKSGKSNRSNKSDVASSEEEKSDKSEGDQSDGERSDKSDGSESGKSQKSDSEKSDDGKSDSDGERSEVDSKRSKSKSASSSSASQADSDSD